ncbi:MAG: hypothetical protein ACT6QU_09195 [Aliihoeflea sp.]|uniref:hypothetical protein n=1 Tax=Aliihoeflea sp. TaxID=2608088 RepID=UPI004033C47A
MKKPQAPTSSFTARSARLPRRQTTDGGQPSTPRSHAAGELPRLDAIAALPTHAERRAALRAANLALSGQEPSERAVDYQMILSGLAAGRGAAAGHGGGKVSPGLPGLFDDPAVVVGLVLHHVRHFGSRGIPISRRVLRALDQHAARGDATARLVRDWLATRMVPCGKRQLWISRGGAS